MSNHSRRHVEHNVECVSVKWMKRQLIIHPSHTPHSTPMLSALQPAQLGSTPAPLYTRYVATYSVLRRHIIIFISQRRTHVPRGVCDNVEDAGGAWTVETPLHPPCRHSATFRAAVRRHTRPLEKPRFLPGTAIMGGRGDTSPQHFGWGDAKVNVPPLIAHLV